MVLEAYRKKRNFQVTPEPSGDAPPRAKARGKAAAKALSPRARGSEARASKTKRAPQASNSFVIQKHAARRLHYDFRLELDGVLKSWAVTRGPSLVPGEKRLAVHVEDHPLDYGDFEGTIPKGEYGGGTVIVWDRGSWAPIGDPHKGYEKGSLDFTLSGEKLKGRWHLVRLKKKRGEKHENWLLLKGEDAHARKPDEADILTERPESAKTGRQIDDVADEAPGWSSKTGRIEPPSATPAQIDLAAVKGAKKAAVPTFIEPALATLMTKPPIGKNWIHEIKLDGYRIQVRIDGGDVRLLTRKGLDWSTKFGKRLLSAFQALPVTKAVIDGELVVESGAGASDFSLLQADLSDGRKDRFIYYAFDLLHLDGYDLRKVALTQRKEILAKILPGLDAEGAASGAPSGILRFNAQFDEDGALLLKHACRLSLEGIISKRGDQPYPTGRSKDWIKSKCSQRQEFVIAGYKVSSVSNRAIGSLLLGAYDGKKLNYIGHVGTGFTAAVARDLFAQLQKLRTDTNPYTGIKPTRAEARGAQFVKAHLVAEIEVRRWTADRILRHASFRGLREDKAASDVSLESKPVIAKTKTDQPIKLSHPDRLYWPDVGVTKAGLADYYSDVWRYMGPLIVQRPLALLRCPDGVGQQCFFQKHAWQGHAKAIALFKDPLDKSAQPLVAIRDFDGLVGLVQAGVLEIHPWGAQLTSLEKPDYITMDLDPGEDVPWARVVAAAHEVRARLGAVGLAAFVKTSGGKGLHVVTPLKPKADWAAVKAFTKAMADAMAKDDAARYVSVITKAKRHGRILVDYLRNGRGATAVAAYSTRARPGAAVSMPIAWDELEAIAPDYFNVTNAATRLASVSADPWADFFMAAVPLPAPSAMRKTTAGKKLARKRVSEKTVAGKKHAPTRPARKKSR